MKSLQAAMNPAQKEAVLSLEGPLLVLAGAGSGKTRILTHRIAHLIESGTAFPGEIFAVTFTNKAAKEMQHRVNRILEGTGISSDDIWISTFHSSGARILRSYGDRLGLEKGFTIFDDGESIALIKQCLEELGISDKVVAPKAVHYKIQAIKNEGDDPAQFKAGSHDFFEKKIEPVVHAYERGLRKNNAIDFGDLLLKPFQLFQQDFALLEAFQDRYRYFLVDEYQDTNGIQYRLLKLLAAKYRNICVVGDEDQSIYKWRGADIRNILDFEKDYPEAKVVKLEENYRSTGHIIRAANKVIANNTQRKSKNLFTSNDHGDQVEVHHLENDLEEARWVVKKIKETINKGEDPKEIALFYRTHAQSRLFEDSLRAERIDYKIFGGLKFYDRAEIKNALAYLKSLANPRDDMSLQRIINVPARGIGKTSIDALKNLAFSEKLSFWEACQAASRGAGDINTGTRKKLQSFVDLMIRLNSKIKEYSPRELYSFMLEETGYLRAIEADKDVEAVARLENLEELASALGDYESRHSQSPSLEGFLEEVALYTDQDRSQEDRPSVTLMTIHSAKGLEFRNVFLVGMEEELFPSIRGDNLEPLPDDVEEERRLCYVGMTRARKRLYLSSAHLRRVFGTTKIRRPSRFVSELPKGEIILKDHAPSTRSFSFGDDESFEQSSFKKRSTWNQDSFADAYSAPRSARSASFDEFYEVANEDDGYKVGSKVKHPDFGTGTVVARSGSRDSLKLSINFGTLGTKKFLAKFAPLERLS